MEQVLALPPSDNTNDAFVREVDEEFRRDQLLGIWKKYGKWIGGAIALGLLVLAGLLYFRGLGERAAGNQGRQFETALTDIAENRGAKADPELRKLATDGNPGYRAMALFAEAEVLFAKKDLKGAAARYAEIAGDTQLPQPFRDRAMVQQTMVEFDTMKPQAVIDRLKGLAVPDSPWFGSAGEMVAAAYLKLGKRDQAAKLYGQIGQSSGPVPDSIHQRAVQIAGTLGVDATKQAEEKKAQ
jgi:hypothetical protein